jgi:hypothetical protein
MLSKLTSSTLFTTIVALVLGTIGVSDPGMQVDVKTAISAGMAFVVAIHTLLTHLTTQVRTRSAASVQIARAATPPPAAPAEAHVNVLLPPPGAPTIPTPIG